MAATARARASSHWSVRRSLHLLLIHLLTIGVATGRHVWENPGCYKVGHTRRISIAGCVEFDMTTNACRGYCESYAIPSAEDVLSINSNHVITSYGQCCNILDTEDVRVNVMCIDGLREVVFKSAKTCSCYHCKKD